MRDLLILITLFRLYDKNLWKSLCFKSESLVSPVGHGKAALPQFFVLIKQPQDNYISKAEVDCHLCKFKLIFITK